MDKKEELREVAKEKLPDPIIIIGYIEHTLDLCCQLVTDICEEVTLSEEAQYRLNMLKDLLQYSSIDFGNITNQLESYKIPKAKELKQYTRRVQKQYLNAQIRENVF